MREGREGERDGRRGGKREARKSFKRRAIADSNNKGGRKATEDERLEKRTFIYKDDPYGVCILLDAVAVKVPRFARLGSGAFILLSCRGHEPTRAVNHLRRNGEFIVSTRCDVDD